MWSVEQVRELRAWLWASETDFTEILGREVTCLNTGTEKKEVLVFGGTYCTLVYETVDSESGILSAFWLDKRHL